MEKEIAKIDKLDTDKKDKENAEKNEKYRKFLDDNLFDRKTMTVETLDTGQDGSTFEIWTLPIKIGSITIK